MHKYIFVTSLFFLLNGISLASPQEDLLQEAFKGMKDLPPAQKATLLRSIFDAAVGEDLRAMEAEKVRREQEEERRKFEEVKQRTKSELDLWEQLAASGPEAAPVTPPFPWDLSAYLQQKQISSPMNMKQIEAPVIPIPEYNFSELIKDIASSLFIKTDSSLDLYYKAKREWLKAHRDKPRGWYKRMLRELKKEFPHEVQLENKYHK